MGVSELALQQIVVDGIAKRREALHALLADAVADGASVGFLDPLSKSDVAAYWRDVAAELAHGQRHMIVAEQAGHDVGGSDHG